MQIHKYIALLSLVCSIWFLTISIGIHFLRADLGIISATLSQYALGEHGQWLTSGFYSIGLTQLLIACLILPVSNRHMKISLLFILAGFGVILVGVFPVQKETADLLARLPHIAGALLQFMFFPLALINFTRQLSQSTFSNYTRYTAYLTTGLFLIILFLYVIKSWIEIPVFGIIEKLDIMLIAAWLIYASYYLPKYLAEKQTTLV